MSARDKKLIVILIGVAVLALSYFLVFQKAQDKRSELLSENHELNDRYNTLSDLASKVDKFQADVNSMNGEMEEILVHYPSYLQIENTIMDVVSIEEETHAKVNSLSVATALAVDVMTGETIEENEESGETAEAADDTAEGESSETTDEGATDESADANSESTGATVGRQIYQLYGVANTVTFTASNKSLQKFIQLISDSDNRQKIESLTVAFNESTGKLDGTLIYDAYFLYGMDKPYDSPYIPSMPHGSKNLFGTSGE